MTENEFEICERFKKVRLFLEIKQGDFAKEIKTTQGHVSDIENKRKGVSDRIIEIICLKFGVSEEWLRTGTGNMICIPTDDYTAIVVDIDRNDKKARQAIIDYWNLTESDKKLFWKFVERFIIINPKEKGGE